jgi:hypothetical protein
MAVRGWRVWCAAVLAGLTLVGCAGPSWTYVTNSEDRTYLKVPTTWHQVDQAAIKARFNVKETSGLWFAAYDADASPSIDHLFGNAAAPVIFTLVQDVPQASRGQLSLDQLRDFFNPVSPAGQQAASLSGGGGSVTTISDEVLTPGHGVHGVHIVYGKASPLGAPQVYDQVGYLNEDASKLYLFVAQCSLDCYQQRKQEITTVVSSFTVREKP